MSKSNALEILWAHHIREVLPNSRQGVDAVCEISSDRCRLIRGKSPRVAMLQIRIITATDVPGECGLWEGHSRGMRIWRFCCGWRGGKSFFWRILLQVPGLIRCRLALLLRMGLSLGFVQDNLRDSLELATKAKHTFDAPIGLVGDKRREEVHNNIHQFDVGSCPGVIGILKDVGEQSDERRDRIVQD